MKTDFSHLGGDCGQTAVTLLVHVWLLGTLVTPPEKTDREGVLNYLHTISVQRLPDQLKNESEFPFYCHLNSTKKARLLQGPGTEEPFSTKLESEGLILRGCWGRRGVLCSNSNSLVWDESDRRVDVSSDVFTLLNYLNIFKMTASVGCNRLF